MKSTQRQTAELSRDWLKEEWKRAGFGSNADILSQLEYAIYGLDTLTKMLDINDVAQTAADSDDDSARPLMAGTVEGLRHAAIALAGYSHTAIQNLRDRGAHHE